MSRSESDTDLAKYMPSIEAMREQADEKAAQERMRRALDNPALDAAIEELRGEAMTLPMPAPAPTRHAPAPVPLSPWGAISAEAGAIDKGLLPSANAPAAPPVTTPIEGDEPPPPAKSWSMTSKALAAIALAFLPAMLVFMLFVKPPHTVEPETAQYVSTSASASVPPLASVAVSAAPVVSAAPSSTQAPSVESAAPVPSTSAVAPPVAPERPKPGKSSGDPYDSAVPTPAKTSNPPIPTAPSPATVVPAVTTAPFVSPPPSSDPTSPKGLPYRKKD